MKIPDAWKLVPTTPTDEMNAAGFHAQDKWLSANCDNQKELKQSFSEPRYQAMINAAPSAPLVAVGDNSQTESLKARLSIHAADRNNTAFARSTMHEALEVFAGQVAPQATVEPLTDDAIAILQELVSACASIISSDCESVKYVDDFESLSIREKNIGKFTSDTIFKLVCRYKDMTELKLRYSESVKFLLAATPTSKATEPEGPEFTIADGDLDWLMNLTADMLQGRGNMDVGIAWNDALETVLARLATSKADTGDHDQAHPMQPIVTDEHGTIRFKENAIVLHLLNHGGIDMNMLARLHFADEHRIQFAQLIGYSVSGFGDLSYVTDEVYAKAELKSATPSTIKADHINDAVEMVPARRDRSLIEALRPFAKIADDYSDSEDDGFDVRCDAPKITLLECRNARDELRELEKPLLRDGITCLSASPNNGVCAACSVGNYAACSYASTSTIKAEPTGEQYVVDDGAFGVYPLTGTPE